MMKGENFDPKKSTAMKATHFTLKNTQEKTSQTMVCEKFSDKVKQYLCVTGDKVH